MIQLLSSVQYPVMARQYSSGNGNGNGSESDSNNGSIRLLDQMKLLYAVYEASGANVW